MPAFRAVSLDMWFTAFFRTAELERRWEAARRRALEDLIRPDGPSAFPREAVLHADDRVRESLAKNHRNPDEIAPSQYLESVASVLGGRVVDADAAGRYSLAGFVEDPPELNPEVPVLRSRLEAAGVPLVLTTNTHRLGASLLSFFARRGEPYFDAIITSCEVGERKPAAAVFRAVAHRLRLPVADVLHVGDRFDSDVEGARRAGMGAALYTGYWERYPPSSEEAEVRDRNPPDRSTVVVSDLTQLMPLVLGRG